MGSGHFWHFSVGIISIYPCKLLLGSKKAFFITMDLGGRGLFKISQFYSGDLIDVC